MKHLSSGDLLREAVAAGTPAGKKAGALMKRGELVPDNLISVMVRDFLRKADPSACYLLDGFPRTHAQALQLDEILADCGVTFLGAVFLSAPESVILDRITGRRVCPACKNIHHIKTCPPKTEGVCDLCGEALVQRLDDHPATVSRRLAVYRDATAGLITLYSSRNLLIALDSNVAPGDLAEQVLSKL